MANDLDPRLTPAQRFGQDLSRARNAKGLSQSALASHLGVSKSLIGHIEIGDRTPKADFAARCDEFFDSGDKFRRLARNIKSPTGPGWYIRWMDEIEPRARILRTWDPLLIPGLLQTEEYARAVFRGDIALTDQEIEDGVSARMRRKLVLDSDRPPALWVLLDEAVLHRFVGNAKIMADQLDCLLTIDARQNVTMQILPLNAPVTAGFISGFIIAELPDAPTTVSVESAGENDVSADHDFVSKIWERYDRIRAEVCPSGQSLEIIKKARDQWKQKA